MQLCPRSPGTHQDVFNHRVEAVRALAHQPAAADVDKGAAARGGAAAGPSSQQVGMHGQRGSGGLLRRARGGVGPHPHQARSLGGGLGGGASAAAAAGGSLAAFVHSLHTQLLVAPWPQGQAAVESSRQHSTQDWAMPAQLAGWLSRASDTQAARPAAAAAWQPLGTDLRYAGALPGTLKGPSVVAADQLSLDHASLGERGQAVRAGILEAAPGAGGVPPQHQLAPEQGEWVGPVGGEVSRHCNGIPLLQPGVGRGARGCGSVGVGAGIGARFGGAAVDGSGSSPGGSAVAALCGQGLRGQAACRNA